MKINERKAKIIGATPARPFLVRALALAVLGLALLAQAGGPARAAESPPLNFIQEGEASWYGNPFHGRKTASGERYNMYELTCAHRTLPFGAKLKVTNLETGESVVVVVNDRGPFAKGRIIDLSYAAAKELGIVSTGVARVRIEIAGAWVPPPVLEPPAPEQEPPPPDKITVLTFNVFDAFFGPNREERMTALPAAIFALHPVPDIIVLEEAFNSEHRRLIVDDLKRLGYPVRTEHYLKRQYGTGILLISRFPLDLVEYTPYRVAGEFFDPERYAGKGILHYRLSTPFGPLELFATHPIARFKPLYDKRGEHVDRDRKTIDRLLEMERLTRTMMEQADPRARSVLLAGDLNVSPDMWEYQFLRTRAGMEDSYEATHPGEVGSTYSPDNTFNDTEWSRIDHILYRNREGDQGFWLLPVAGVICLREPIELDDRRGRTNLSDHFGVLSAFEVRTEPGAVAMSPPMRPERMGGSRSRADLDGSALRLTPANRLAWQNWAVATLDRADRRYNRYDERVIPAARILIAGEVLEPTVIPLTPAQKLMLTAGLVREP